MDKATLVRGDLEIEGRVVEALSRAKIPVSLCAVDRMPETGDLRLVIATPWYDKLGPSETYHRILTAFQKAGIYKEVPLLRIYARSPDDPLVRDIEQEIKIRREGAIHIVGHPGANHNKHYSVVFAPFSGKGGFIPAKRISGIQELREFLEKHLHVHKTSVDEALAELERTGTTSIFQVQLTSREAKKLKLA